MPDDPEKQGGEPNLELPSLFGRGRKKKRQESAPAEDTDVLDAPVDEPTADSPGEPEAPTQSGPAPVVGSARRLPPTPPPPAREADVEETAPIQASAPAAPPEVEPVPEPTPVEPTPVEPTPVEPTPEPAPAEPVPDPTPVEPAPEPTPAQPAPEPTPVQPPPGPPPVQPEPTPEPQPAPVEQTTVLPSTPPQPPAEEPEGETVGAPLFADEQPRRRREPKERTPLALPRINPRIAVAFTGIVVGLVGVVLSFGASRGCEAARGVGSCGGIGLFALLAVLLIEVVLGGILLKGFGIPDPTSTSFLGVGLVAVLALLFFLSSLESVWMLLVIPVLTAITFLISWWVTETFVEQGADDNMHR